MIDLKDQCPDCNRELACVAGRVDYQFNDRGNQGADYLYICPDNNCENNQVYLRQIELPNTNVMLITERDLTIIVKPVVTDEVTRPEITSRTASGISLSEGFFEFYRR